MPCVSAFWMLLSMCVMVSSRAGCCGTLTRDALSSFLAVRVAVSVKNTPPTDSARAAPMGIPIIR